MAKAEKKDKDFGPYVRLRQKFMDAMKDPKSAEKKDWPMSASDLFTLIMAVDDYRIRRKDVETMEDELYAVYETGRQKGLDSARWLAMELSRARIRPCWDKCAKCSDYSADSCACCWVQASIDAVKEGRR